MVSIAVRIFAEMKGNIPSEIDVFFPFLGSGICTLKWVLQFCACFWVPQGSLILEPFCDPDTGTAFRPWNCFDNISGKRWKQSGKNNSALVV